MLIGALLALWPASAEAAGYSNSWLQPVSVSPLAYYAQHSQKAAANANGDAIVAWWQVDGSQAISYVRRGPSTGFSAPQTIPGRGGGVRVAMNSRGDAVVTWRDGVGAKGAVIAAGGSPVPFSVASGQEDCTSGAPASGIDDTGRITVFWTDCKRIWYASRPAGGAFNSPRVASTSDRSPGVLDAAVAGDGAGIVAWKDYDGVYAAAGGPGAAFATTVLASNRDSRALYYDPDLGVPALVYAAMNARGDAAVGWTQMDEANTAHAVFATTKPAGGAPRTPQRIQLSSGVGFGPAVDVDPQGRATAAWSGYPKGDGLDGVWTSTSGAGGFSAPARASDADACGGDVAVDREGAVHVVWAHFEHGCVGDTGWQLAATRPPGATSFEPTQIVGKAQAEPPKGFAFFPPVAVAKGPRGALAVWIQGSLAPDYLQRIYVSDTPSADPVRVWPEQPPAPDDTTPPDTSITSGPTGTQTTRNASFSFSSEAGATFECKLDASAWGACTSPQDYSALGDGAHAFSVRARDAAANTDASPATRTWTVDATPPETTLQSGGPSGTVATRSASFGFSAEAGATFECKLDSGAWSACTSPKDYSALGDGTHTFAVRARDAAGNTDPSPASRSWTVSIPATPEPAPAATSPPTISGIARHGELLEAARGTWSGTPGSYSFVWLRCDGDGGRCVEIGGATAQTYTVALEDVGARLRVRVIARRGSVSGVADSAPTALVDVRPLPAPVVEPQNPPPSGSPFGEPATMPPAPRLSLKVPRQRLRKALAKGLKLTVAADGRSTVTSRLLLPRKRGRKPLRPLVVGRAKTKFTKAGKKRVTTKFTRRARSQLRRAKKVKLTLRMKATGPSGSSATTQRKLSLKR